jgi:hypothetical protein
MPFRPITVIVFVGFSIRAAPADGSDSLWFGAPSSKRISIVPKLPEGLIIDIPVRMDHVKLVHSIGALQFEGDLPASIFHLQLILRDVADWKAQAEIIAVFHTNAGHVTLNDAAYHRSRNADLLPEVKINLDAMARTIQLVQQGFIKISE